MKAILHLMLATILAVMLATPSRCEAKMPIAQIGNNKIKLEVAQTDAEIQRGLMWRTSLPTDHGMVFLFSPAKKVKFWMANCFISLDMFFIRDGKIIAIAQNVPPCKAAKPEDCPTYPDQAVEVSEVVEVNAGYAKKHGIKEGDPVKFLFLSDAAGKKPEATNK